MGLKPLLKLLPGSAVRFIGTLLLKKEPRVFTFLVKNHFFEREDAPIWQMAAELRSVTQMALTHSEVAQVNERLSQTDRLRLLNSLDKRISFSNALVEVIASCLAHDELSQFRKAVKHLDTSVLRAVLASDLFFVNLEGLSVDGLYFAAETLSGSKSKSITRVLQILAPDTNQVIIPRSFIGGRSILNVEETLIKQGKVGNTLDMIGGTEYQSLVSFKARRDDTNRKKILFASQANWNFMHDVVQHAANKFDVETLDTTGLFSPHDPTELANISPIVESSIRGKDIVFCEWANESAACLSMLAEKRNLIVRLHSYELLRRWLLEINWDAVHTLISVSQANLNRLLEEIPLPSLDVNCAVIPNFIQHRGLEELAFPIFSDKRITIGMMGYNTRNKDLRFALDVAEGLQEHGHSVTMRLAGGPLPESGREYDLHRDYFDDLAARLESTEVEICLDGWVLDTPKWIEGCQAVFSTSLREGTHEVAREATMAGRLVLAREWPWLIGYGRITDFFPHAVSGSDPLEIATNFARLLKDQDALRETVANSRTHILSTESDIHVANQLDSVYQEVLNAN
jgi:glycosyltransferase involved in cell wall biosynthesis